MKKNETRKQEQTLKPRRLRLSRETLKVLNDPAALGLAKGGITPCQTGSSTLVSDVTGC